MAVYKKVPGCKTVNISTLEFDETPTPGSLNPVTSGGVAESVAQQSSNIAEAFSASSTYAIGEVVIGPDGKLYQCTTAVETAGEWDPEDWDETSLGDILFISRGSSNIEVRKSHCKVGDAVYADSDGNVHFIAGKSVTAASIPEGWEFVGVVALREGTKATILHKNENTNVKWASMWLFKVNGLKLDGTDTFVLQQGPASGNTPVEIGTFTASEEATNLDTLVAELDEWLRENATAEGALANYNWHAEKHADADGVDSCFIVVDNFDVKAIASSFAFSVIKSSSSGATAPIYLFEFAGLNDSINTIMRKDGVNSRYVIWNKEKFTNYGSSVGSPTDSLTTQGVYSETGFNGTTVVKGYYGTYDNYLDHMLPDEGASVGAYAAFKGKGKEIFEKTFEVSFPNLAGTETKVFVAEYYAASIKAHSTASVEGLNEGDFFIPSIDTLYKILSAMKLDGSDVVNSSLVKAGANAVNLDRTRIIPSRNTPIATFKAFNFGGFGDSGIYIAGYCRTVAEIDL